MTLCANATGSLGKCDEDGSPASVCDEIPEYWTPTGVLAHSTLVRVGGCVALLANVVVYLFFPVM